MKLDLFISSAWAIGALIGFYFAAKEIAREESKSGEKAPGLAVTTLYMAAVFWPISVLFAAALAPVVFIIGLGEKAGRIEAEKSALKQNNQQNK